MLVLGNSEALCRMPSITPITGPMQDQLLRLKSLKPQHVLSLRCEVLGPAGWGMLLGWGWRSPAPQLGRNIRKESLSSFATACRHLKQSRELNVINKLTEPMSSLHKLSCGITTRRSEWNSCLFNSQSL